MAVRKDGAPCRFRVGRFCDITDHVETAADALAGGPVGSTVQHPACMDTTLGDGTEAGEPICPLVTLFGPNLSSGSSQGLFPFI